MWGATHFGGDRRAAATPALACFAVLLILGACGSVHPPERPARARGPASPDTIQLILLGTTDTHGWLLPHNYFTGKTTGHGLALLAPVVDSIRRANPGRVYLFGTGDLLQGTALASLYAHAAAEEPNPIIEAMNRLGYTASAIGNHEFNFGLGHLADAIERARFPFVSANIFRYGTDEHAYRPYALIPHAVGGGDTVLVGVTAVTPPGVEIWDEANVGGVLDFRAVVPSARSAVRELRARGADLVVVLSHGGLAGSSYDTAATGLPPENAAARLARTVEGVDVIFMGHTHRELADTVIGGTLLTQPDNGARSLSAVTVRLVRRGPEDWDVISTRARLLEPAARPDSAFVAALREEHQRTIAYINRPIGRSSERMSARAARVRDTPILDFVNAVQRRITGADLSSTAAFNLSAVIPEGEVTIADIAELYVYPNTLKVVRITGAELRAYLEQSARYYNTWPPDSGGTVTNFDIPGYNYDVVSGVEYTIDLTRPPGERIVELTYKGEPVRPDQVFTLAVNNYRASGGGGFEAIAGAPLIYDGHTPIRRLLIREVKRRGVIRPEDYFNKNWRIVPREAARRALKEQTR